MIWSNYKIKIGVVLLLVLSFAYAVSLDDFLSLFSGPQHTNIEINEDSNSTINNELDIGIVGENDTENQDESGESGQSTSLISDNVKPSTYTFEDTINKLNLAQHMKISVKYRGAFRLHEQRNGVFTLSKNGHDYAIVFDYLDRASVSEDWDGKPMKDFSKVHFMKLDRFVLNFSDGEDALRWYEFFVRQVYEEDDLGRYLYFGTNDCSIEKNKFGRSIRVCYVNMDSYVDFFDVTTEKK